MSIPFLKAPNQAQGQQEPWSQLLQTSAVTTKEKGRPRTDASAPAARGLQCVKHRTCPTPDRNHGGWRTLQGGTGVLAAKPQQQTEVLTPGRAMLRHHTDLDTCTRTYRVVEA